MLGYQRSGTLSGILIFAETEAGCDVSLDRGGRVRASEVILSSGIEMTRLGLSIVFAERSTKVTLTTQSAVSLGRKEDFCPSLVISIDFSSINNEGPNVTVEFESEKDVLEFAPREMKYAGLKMPLGTNAGPFKCCQRF